MVQLNSSGEVADLLNVDQFISGHSAYECVAYAAALCKYAGQPGHGSTGTTTQASNLAQQWYADEEGSNAASNMNGMSMDAEYAMLSGIGLHWQAINATVAAVKDSLSKGYPVVICGAETGFFDMDLGDIVPYGWPPSGNHAIVASGIASDGNLLVHDCAEIGPSGVRTGPRRYDASKMELVSATAILVPWIGEDMISITDPWVAEYFKQTATSPTRWDCAHTGQSLFAGILAGWCAMNGAPRLPTGPETPCGKQAVYQECESGIVLYDPAHEIDAPHGPWEPCYLLKLDSALAKKLLGTSITIPVDIPAIVAALKTLQTYNDTAIQAALKTLGAL